MTDSFLKIRVESKNYGKKQVLRDVDLDISEGEVVAILGASGSGKTTLARCIAGFEEFEGEIHLGETKISKAHPKDRGVGIVPQDGALFPHLDVKENVGFGLKNKSGKDDRIKELLRIVELHDVDSIENKKIDQLSGGQQQRVAVARALSGEPKVIILDESFNSLDRWLRITVRKQILDSIKSTNTTVIVITHDISEAFELADRVAVLEEGNLVQVDDCDTLYARPNSMSVAQLVGVANIVDLNSEVYGSKFLDFSKTEGGKLLMVRPEHIKFFDNSVHSVPLGVVLKEVKTNGPIKHAYLEVENDQQRLMSTNPEIAAKKVGDSFQVGISDQAIIYDNSH